MANPCRNWLMARVIKIIDKSGWPVSGRKASLSMSKPRIAAVAKPHRIASHSGKPSPSSAANHQVASVPKSSI